MKGKSKMKKLISLLLVLICVFTMAGCAKNKNGETGEGATATGQTASQSEVTDGGQQTADPNATLAPSTNKTVVTEETAPDIYWDYSIAYHLKCCEAMQTKKPEKIAWALVKEIALRQCPTCNPPQYENYIENEE